MDISVALIFTIGIPIMSTIGIMIIRAFQPLLNEWVKDKLSPTILIYPINSNNYDDLTGPPVRVKKHLIKKYFMAAGGRPLVQYNSYPYVLDYDNFTKKDEEWFTSLEIDLGDKK